MNEEKRYITVVKETEDGQRTLVNIDIDEVNFIDSPNRKLRFHIDNQIYYQITTIADLDGLIEGFIPLDRVNLVNLRKIKAFDSKDGKVYFEEEPNPDSDFATVAKMKYEFVSSILKRFISHNNDQTMEIIPIKDSKGFRGLLEVFKK